MTILTTTNNPITSTNNLRLPTLALAVAPTRSSPTGVHLKRSRTAMAGTVALSPAMVAMKKAKSAPMTASEPCKPFDMSMLSAEARCFLEKDPCPLVTISANDTNNANNANGEEEDDDFDAPPPAHPVLVRQQAGIYGVHEEEDVFVGEFSRPTTRQLLASPRRHASLLEQSRCVPSAPTLWSTRYAVQCRGM